MNAHLNNSVVQVSGCRCGVVETVSMDALDRFCLKIARQLFLQPDSPAHPAWRAAHDIAQTKMPIHKAAIVVQSLWHIIQHLGNERVSDFSFMPDHSYYAKSFITPEERTLLRMLWFQRRHCHTEARTQCILLCQGGDQEYLFNEALKITNVMTDPRVFGQQNAS